ncbi:MAG: hypothetical protein CVU50_08480 [Candidatus Cloacimonetes bacterium HGW-Cloacimonetes-3]|jgi:hypothetical protein|nr:MAG: hypothetical protein CVU50_08480 [Candidatus Cloacimonetes bacterium HGW-Cloacimonetes-3]
MKVSFQYGLAGYTGKADGLVYCYSKELGRVYARRNTYPKLTSENVRVGSITTALFAIKPSKEFQNDLYLYRVRYNALRENHRQPVRSWSALYLKMMYNMAKADSTIDLKTLTRDDIYAQELPCISINKAVEAGLLPIVYDYETYVLEL